ncbi:MAG: acylphosphatase [Sediminispirochaetaceae bacterium]
MGDNEQRFKACEVKVEGRVQGVGFRYSAIRAARRYQVTGWVRNEYDGSVTLFCEGQADAVDGFVDWCRAGPSSAHVIDVTIIPRTYRGRYSTFSVAY